MNLRPASLLLLVAMHPCIGAAQTVGPQDGDGAHAPSLGAWSDEGAPDARLAKAQAGAPEFSYFHVLGTALKPRGSDTSFVYTSNGCIYVSGGPDIRFQFPVLIPDRSTIKFLRATFVDTGAASGTVWLTTYQPGQSAADLASVSSQGSGGLVSELSGELSHVVNNEQNYTLNFGWGAADSSIQLCGVRIAYLAP